MCCPSQTITRLLHAVEGWVTTLWQCSTKSLCTIVNPCSPTLVVLLFFEGRQSSVATAFVNKLSLNFAAQSWVILEVLYQEAVIGWDSPFLFTAAVARPCFVLKILLYFQTGICFLERGRITFDGFSSDGWPWVVTSHLVILLRRTLKRTATW